MIRWLIARPRVRECRSGNGSFTKFLGRDLLDHVASLPWAGGAGADCGDMAGLDVLHREWSPVEAPQEVDGSSRTLGDGTDVRMLESRRDADLAEEPVAAERGGQLGPEHLDRHLAVMSDALG
jgi:hypothetical protein